MTYDPFPVIMQFDMIKGIFLNSEAGQQYHQYQEKEQSEA
jgi:hypothetical protein